jgi:hypothetical protein
MVVKTNEYASMHENINTIYLLNMSANHVAIFREKNVTQDGYIEISKRFVNQ